MKDEVTNIVNIKRSPIVMVVDDEEMVTKTLAAYLALETDYQVVTFTSPQEALKSLKQKPVDIVISDFLMPDMDGIQFFAEVKKLYPDVTRILLTGYADKENAIKAINQVGIYQYIEKPWDNEGLKMVIRNGIQSKSLKKVLGEKIQELDVVLLERDRLSERDEMLREELSLARNVQRSMLPESFPQMNGITIATKYQPALEIGGDLFDVISLADDKVAVLMADVTGHGIQAALITSVIKSAFSAFRDRDATPADILIFMNRILVKILPTAMFAAAGVLIIDTKSGHCHISNGGIPQPFLLNRNGGLVEQIPATGLLLGIADEETFEPGDEVAFQLKKGETLIFFTDGISEVPNDSGEHFDMKMAQVLLEAKNKKGKDILEHLVNSAKKFSRKDHNWDDIAILGIENES
ncbi:SpoIIE family protein phosphatase [candidate division KSB1 bacterium]|nr:SpoIIE family protein phosphatase [candidate division KSB1 bacterium]